MEILPGQEVQNGENLTLQCVVDISTTSYIKPQHWVLFYKDDVLFHNVSSMETTESYFIPQARVYDAGTYKCTVILNNKEKTTSEYQVWVKGESLHLNELKQMYDSGRGSKNSHGMAGNTGPALLAPPPGIFLT